MARDEPTQDERERMDHIERDLAKFLTRYRENMEVALIVGAMMRIARKLLEKYPEDLERELVKASVAYLQRQDLEASGEPSSFIIPKGIM